MDPFFGGRRHRGVAGSRTSCPWWAALLLLYLSSAQAATGMDMWPLAGAWRPARPGDTPAGVLAQASQDRLRAFDPATLHKFARGPYGAWVVLRPRSPGLSGQRVLSIPSPPFGRVALYGAHGRVLSADLGDANSSFIGYNCLALPIPNTWPATAPLLLKIEPAETINIPMSFTLQSVKAFHMMDLHWTVIASASFGVMLAMALMALCFGVMLRDATFLWYGGYVTAYAVIQAVQTGFLIYPLRVGALAGLTLPVGIASTAISVACAAMFMIRFCELQRYAPRMRVLLVALTAVMIALALLRLADPHHPHLIAQGLLNPLMAVGASLTVLAALLALLRGSRLAGLFLLGWLPLLTLTALSSAQVSGALPDLTWLNAAMLPAGALEAMILSLGLADRTLTIRRDHAVARALADRDPLTGVLNRRAWIEAAQTRVGVSRPRPQVLLFMDLDRFKTLNDVMGHAAGDRALNKVAGALATELRPDDLVARLGGDEFAALLNNTDHDNGARIAERLRERIHRLHIPIDPSGQRLSVSIGLASLGTGDNLGTLIERADGAMYAAKARGGNRWMDRPDTAPARTLLRDHVHEDIPAVMTDAVR